MCLTIAKRAMPAELDGFPDPAPPRRPPPPPPPTVLAPADDTGGSAGSGGGRKFDAGKMTFDLLPMEALAEVQRVLDFGALKYSPWNWWAGMRWLRLWNAALRHLWAWVLGEDRDQETGLSHLAHAACCVLFLLAYTLANRGEDDRRKRPV